MKRKLSKDQMNRDNEDMSVSERKRLKETEERYGVDLDVLNEYFKLDGDVSAVMEKKGFNRKPTPFANVVKDEPKPEEEPEVDETDRKFKGQQYVEIAKEREKQRIIKYQKEEKAKQSTGAEASTSGQNLSNKTRNTSMLSLNTNSTDIESVGTCLPQIPDTIQEDQNMEAIIEMYFKNDRPKRVDQRLPIKQYEHKIIQSIQSNRVVIIEGATGCGKTTQVPQYIADDFASSGIPFNIVVTQPRRIAAKSIAQRVCDERNWKLGSICGYQIGLDKTNVSPDTRITYCTTGILLQRLINQKRMDTYSHIIIDEVHERSIDTDLLLLVIKKLMTQTGTGVKIILMSATFDVTKLRDYFVIPMFNDNGDHIQDVVPSHIKVSERCQPVNTYYYNEIKNMLRLAVTPSRADLMPFDKESPCITVETIDVAQRILEEGLETIERGSESQRGSVLVFLPGMEEINEMMSKLVDRQNRNPSTASKSWSLHPLHSSIPIDKQNAIFKKPVNRERKIILATNIAESSITVPDVEYVIDFCLTKNMVCDLETHIPILRTEWAAKSNCEQRAGRCGRVKEGRVYRLVPKQFYNSFSSYGYPEIVRSPLDLSILRVKILDMGPPKELLGLALDAPDLSDIYHSVLQLKQCGAFTVMVTDGDHHYYEEEDGDITTLGHIMSRLPIDIRLSKLIVMGHVFDVLEETIIIAACLSTQGMFRRDFYKGMDAYKSRLAWADRTFSDPIAFLNAYRMYKQFDTEDYFQTDRRLAERWCKQNFIQYKRITEVDHMINDIVLRLRHENIQIPQRPNQRRNRVEQELILKVVMCAAFYPNYFVRQEIDDKYIPKTLSIHDPYNTVAIQGLPQNQGVIYAPQIRELFKMCSNQMNIHFEDTKAYITFLDDIHPLKAAHDLHIHIDDRDGRETPMSETSNQNNNMLSTVRDTAIKTAVYVAVAMKNHREISKEIFKYSAEAVKIKMETLNKVKTEDHFQPMKTHRITVPNVISRVKLTKLALPAMDCSEISIKVTHVENPHSFFAQYYHQITDQSLSELSNLISYDLESVRCCESTLRLGDIVIAPYKDSSYSLMYGRAKVEVIECKDMTKQIEQVKVFFIDYGFRTSFTKVEDMTQITARSDQQLVKIPPQAFECRLSEITPSPVNCPDGVWNHHSVKLLKSFVKERNFVIGKIYSVVNRVVRLELFDEHNREISLNDEMISRNFAEKGKEESQSRMNHEQRRKALLTRDHSLGTFRLESTEQKPLIYNSDDIIEIEVDDNFGLKTSQRTINLISHEKMQIKGPFSPIEATYVGIQKQTSNRSIRIDRNSVNCVVLEPDYLSKHTRLITASSVGLSQTTGHINLRDTSLMPNIRGFPALMALLFAPRVELRVNKDNNEYFGAITGLGFSNNTKKSYDPESDAEIIFDTDVSQEDLAKINIIRYHISDLLKSREVLREYVEGTLAMKQRKCRTLITQLLARKRRLTDWSEYHPNYRWGKYPSDVHELDQKEDILPIHFVPKINDFDWFQFIKDNLDQLKAVQEGSISMITTCKLCKFTAYTHLDLCSHMNSDQHLDAVIDFNKDFKMNEEEKRVERFYAQQEDDEEEEDIADESSQSDYE